MLRHLSVANLRERKIRARAHQIEQEPIFTSDYDIYFVAHVYSPASQCAGSAARTGTFRYISTSSGVRNDRSRKSTVNASVTLAQTANKRPNARFSSQRGLTGDGGAMGGCATETLTMRCWSNASE